MVYDKENSKSIIEFKNIKFTLVTGIADSTYLINYLNDNEYNFNHISFKDHHDFSNSDIIKIDQNDLIITTEKDYVKLFTKITSVLYYLPIEFVIDNEVDFNKQILDYIQTGNS
jgi:tetraacyldisaccharide 4'-kinase